ncbi:MAG: PorV/PorQ family protein [bacterium]|nr:PorV/PorQ family protein [bacterium]
MPSLLFGGVGTHTFDFLNIPNGARYAGIGGCSMGMVGDPFTLFSNPAWLQTLQGKKIGFNYTQYIAGIQGGGGAYVLPLLNGVVGVGISYLNSGNMEKLDEYGNPVGSGIFFTSQTLMPIFGYATTLGNLPAGINFKIIYQTIDEYSSLAVATDAGFVFPIKAYPGLTLGGTVQNLGRQVVKFDTQNEPMPTFARVGGNYLLFNNNVRISAEISLPDRELIFGAEWLLSPILTLRGGYYSLGKELKTGSSLDIFGGLCFGLGFTRHNLTLDYAITPKVELGIVNQISLLWTL